MTYGAQNLLARFARSTRLRLYKGTIYDRRIHRNAPVFSPDAAERIPVNKKYFRPHFPFTSFTKKDASLGRYRADKPRRARPSSLYFLCTRRRAGRKPSASSKATATPCFHARPHNPRGAGPLGLMRSPKYLLLAFVRLCFAKHALRVASAGARTTSYANDSATLTLSSPVVADPDLLVLGLLCSSSLGSGPLRTTAWHEAVGTPRSPAARRPLRP